MAIMQKRVAEDQDDKYLLSIGWKFAGLTLFEYPLNDDFRGFYTKEKALALTKEEGLDMYCPACGSCGEEECCRPEKCICFYAEHYNKTYRELSDEHEAFFQLIKALAAEQSFDLYLMPRVEGLIVDARKLLEEFGYDTK